MKRLPRTSLLIIFSLFFLLSSLSESYGQRGIDYRDLANQQQQTQNIYFDFFTLPGSENGKVQFLTTFRIDNEFLPFKKINQPSEEDKKFYSVAALSIEIFKSDEQKFRKKKEDVSVKGLEPITRAFWKDTAYAATYEETQSNKKFINGNLQVQLPPGYYTYLLQLNRGEDADEQNSRTRHIKINPYKNSRTGNVILAESVDNSQNPGSAKLLNFGNNVYYGKDFYALIHLPDYDAQSTYSVKINRIRTTDKDTTKVGNVFDQNLTDQQIITGIKPALKGTNQSLSLNLEKMNGGYAYALLNVPNSTFPNAVYQLTVTDEVENKPVTQGVFRSLWLDMPASLLSLDVAIDMTRFITDKETLRDLKDGSRAEKEKKLRAFWKSKDPTPDTEYNELMAEYYRRIDYAYEEFSTQNTLGYESDQGQVYIKYGPPKNIDRKFPPGEPALEIWTYGSKEFIFKATTGFGDFELVSR